MTATATTARRVLLLHRDPGEAGVLAEALTEAGFEVQAADGAMPALDELFHNPPAVILAAEGAGGRSVETLARDLKADPLLGRLPLVVLIRDVRVDGVDWNALGVDDYIAIPYKTGDVVRRLQLCLGRMARSLDANPLTRLPGNTSILFETTRRIESGRPFALAYLDVDNFKSFNDRYGYGRGDEVLVVTCRLLTTVVSELAGPEGFVGHVGGDDFVFMSDPAVIDACCETLIKRFDLVIPDFYDREDRLRGSIDSVDRRGNREEFPIMTLSIAVVTNELAPIRHPGDISKIVSQLKKQAKGMQGSVYLKDQRATDRQL
jgi:GGDEF domain-containing protein